MIPTRLRFVLAFLALVFCPILQISAQTPEQIRFAFRNIRNDDIPHNADTASDWIYAHRKPLKNELLDELYRTDRQGRDVIFFALMGTKDFQPDERFRRLLMARLNEEDQYVKNDDLHLFVHWYAWRFVNAHYDVFKKLLLENLETTNDMLCIWQTARQLQRRGELAATWPTFPQHVWDTAAVSLKQDEISFNAGQAVRFYLMIGKGAVPYLQVVTKSKDTQARDFAHATIDAIGGSRNAYGYLGSEIAFTSFRGSDGDESVESKGITDEIQNWVFGEKSERKRYNSSR